MRSLPLKSKLLLGVVVLAGGIPIACGGGGSSSGSASTQSGAGGAGGNTSVQGSGGDITVGIGSGGSTLLVTCPTYVIDVLNGVSAPVDCEATEGGNPVGAAWVVDLSGIAGVDKDGIVQATGKQGGELAVRAAYNGLTAEVKLTVNLKKLDNPAGVAPTEQDTLKGAVDADVTTQWTYPYNGTVFPKGLLAPELMWNNGGPDDVYYIHFKGKYIDFETFAKVPPPSRFAADPSSWQELTESGKGGPVNLTVTRMPAGSATASVVANHSWTIANGSLRGTVYYWANSLGRVLRIKPGEPAPDDFLANAGQSGCSTCHAVSADGSTLVLGGDIGVSTFDLLTNTTILDIKNVGKDIRNWAMPAVSPNGKVLVENNAPLPGPPGGSDGMWDTTTGQKLMGTGLDGVLLDMPAFAPNGTKLAYVDHATKGLSIFDFDVNTTMVTKGISLVPAGADANLNCIAFPSVSPDAKWIVYHRGQYSNSLDTRFGPGSLYLASVEQPGVEVRLGGTNGDSYPFAAGDRDKNYNYEPTFAPLNSGGYAWIVFTSRRTYGNQLTGGKDSVKQLWVTAIDQDAKPGVDPSHPSFWVPGQDLGTLNMRGFWALNPCKVNAADSTCTTGSDCCGGNCDNGICTDPDPSECVKPGNHCEKSSECCEGECINNSCSEPPPT